jgi:hypothetical protein
MKSRTGSQSDERACEPWHHLGVSRLRSLSIIIIHFCPCISARRFQAPLSPPAFRLPVRLCSLLPSPATPRCTRGLVGDGGAVDLLHKRRTRFQSGRSGLLAAVSRIAAILPNDLAPTNMNGPYRPLAIHPSCCSAARQTSHSLHARKPMVGEFTHFGLCSLSPRLLRSPAS